MENSDRIRVGTGSEDRGAPVSDTTRQPETYLQAMNGEPERITRSQTKT